MTPDRNEHPSYYVLDRLRLGGEADVAQRAHAARCPDCAAYLRAVVQSPDEAPLPEWVAKVRLRQPPSGGAGWRRWLWPALSLAAVGGVVLVIGLRPGAPVAPLPGIGEAPALAPAPAVREKGAPALALYIKRGAQVFEWDGRRSIQPGDRLRLRVDGAGYGHVSVAALPAAEAAAPAVLHAGALAPGPVFLPVSFGVDDRGEQEVLSIILAAEPVPATWHRRDADHPPLVAGWRRVLTLDKERDPPR